MYQILGALPPYHVELLRVESKSPYWRFWHIGAKVQHGKVVRTPKFGKTEVLPRLARRVKRAFALPFFWPRWGTLIAPEALVLARFLKRAKGLCFALFKAVFGSFFPKLHFRGQTRPFWPFASVFWRSVTRDGLSFVGWFKPRDFLG